MIISTSQTRSTPPKPTQERPAVTGSSTRLHVLDGLSLLLAALMTAASVGGLVNDGLYRDNTWSTSAFRGTDAATVAVAVPTLLVALLLARRGWLGARLVWLGVLGYAVYNYAFYLFGTAFNDFFLLYAAAEALAVALLVFAAAQVRPVVPAPARGPVRTVGGYLIAVGLMFGALWTAQSLSYVTTGKLPKVIADSGLHTSIVFALDLTLIVPWLVIAGVLLWRRTAAGLALAIGMNTLAVLYMTALAVAGAFQHKAGIAGMSWTAFPYLEIGIASLVALVPLLRGLTPAVTPPQQGL